jgi:hypothetical protein
MRKKGIDRDIVVLLISTLITVSSWVGFEVYRAYFKQVVPKEVQSHLVKIDPHLNSTVLSNLETFSP